MSYSYDSHGFLDQLPLDHEGGFFIAHDLTVQRLM